MSFAKAAAIRANNGSQLVVFLVFLHYSEILSDTFTHRLKKSGDTPHDFAKLANVKKLQSCQITNFS
jgi:hypothetical protein